MDPRSDVQAWVRCEKGEKVLSKVEYVFFSLFWKIDRVKKERWKSSQCKIVDIILQAAVPALRLSQLDLGLIWVFVRADTFKTSTKTTSE